MVASRGGMFIWSKLRQNLSDVRTFARIKEVIWDQLLATKAEITQINVLHNGKDAVYVGER